MGIPDLDLSGLESWLKTEVVWPQGMSMIGLRPNRLWPNKHGGLTFELAVDVQFCQEHSTHMIQGGPLSQVKCAMPSREALLDSGWIMNLSLSNTELDVSLLSPDRDPRLSVTKAGKAKHALPDLLGGTQAARFLDLTVDRNDLGQHVVAYRMGKRCVFRLNNRASPDKPFVFLKSFRRLPTEESLATYRDLGLCLKQRSGGLVRVPSILDYLPDARVLIFEGADRSARHLGRRADDLRVVANVLSLLHALPTTISSSHRPHNEISIANRWLPLLEVSDREHYEQMRALIEHLTLLSERLPARPCCLVHRDFYAAQVLQQGDHTWIVDLDTMSMAHPEVDIATFSAHLLLDELVDGSTDDEAVSQVRFFLELYRNQGGNLSLDHLHFYLTSAIARLAAIHTTRGLDRSQVDRLWRLANEVADWS